MAAVPNEALFSPGLNMSDILPIVHLWRVNTHRTCHSLWHLPPAQLSSPTVLTVQTRLSAMALVAVHSSWLLPPRGERSASGMFLKWWRSEHHTILSFIHQPVLSLSCFFCKDNVIIRKYYHWLRIKEFVIVCWTGALEVWHQSVWPSYPEAPDSV